MTHTTLQALGQTRIAELQDQAQRDALVRASRRARHARKHARLDSWPASPAGRAPTAPAPGRV